MRAPKCVELGKPLPACAAALKRILQEHCLDLPGPWIGWRLRGRRLLGPGGVTLTPETLRLAAAWVRRAEDVGSGAADASGSPAPAGLDAREG